MSIIFYHNTQQKVLALQTKERQSLQRNAPIYTKIVPYERFYPAEEYHQKHTLRLYPNLMEEYKAIYPDSHDFNTSTAVARLNGYLSGYGGCDRLRAEIDSLGLSGESKRKVISIVCGHR